MKKEKTDKGVVTLTYSDMCGVSEADVAYFVCPVCGYEDIAEGSKKCAECGVRLLWDFDL